MRLAPAKNESMIKKTSPLADVFFILEICMRYWESVYKNNKIFIS